MSYTSNVPQGNQSISQTQPIINANFQALTSFGNGYAEISNQVATPSFSGGNDGLYTLNNTDTSLNEMYIHKQTFAGTSEIPFTASILSQAAPVMAADGWTYLPSGIIMRWDTITGTGLTTVTLGGTAPVLSTIFAVVLCPYASNIDDTANFAARLVTILSNTQYQVYFSYRTISGPTLGRAQALVIGM